ESFRKSKTDLAQAFYYGVRIVVHTRMRHIISSDSLGLNHAETGRSRNYSGKIEPGIAQKRAELRFGALPATGADQHVYIIGCGTTRHVGLIDARRINTFGDQQLGLRCHRTMHIAQNRTRPFIVPVVDYMLENVSVSAPWHLLEEVA